MGLDQSNIQDKIYPLVNESTASLHVHEDRRHRSQKLLSDGGR